MSSSAFAFDDEIIFHQHFDGVNNTQDFIPDYMPFYAYTYSANAGSVGIPRIVDGGKFSQYYFSAEDKRFSYNWNYLRYVNIPNIEAGDDYTIDFWIYIDFQQFGGSGYIMCNSANRISNPPNWAINHTPVHSQYEFVYWEPGAALYVNYLPNQWYHIAFVREGLTLKSYMNGVLDESVVSTSQAIDFSVLTIGDIFVSGNAFGNIAFGLDEFRITKGAKWTSNFTPYNAPYAYAPIQRRVIMQTDGKTHMKPDGELKLDWNRGE